VASKSRGKPWSSFWSRSSEFVVRLRQRRSHRSFGDALVWPRTVLARLAGWPKRRRLTIAVRRSHTKRFRAQLAKVLRSPTLRRWRWLFAIGAAALVAFATIYLLGTDERSTRVVQSASSASVRAVSTRPNTSASAILRVPPKPSASHR